MRYQENKIVDSFKNTGEQAITKWGNDFIINNLPKALDCMVTKFKESVLTVSKNENNKMNEQIRDIIFKGIEIGEYSLHEADCRFRHSLQPLPKLLPTQPHFVFRQLLSAFAYIQKQRSSQV